MTAAVLDVGIYTTPRYGQQPRPCQYQLADDARYGQTLHLLRTSVDGGGAGAHKPLDLNWTTTALFHHAPDYDR